MKLRGYIIDTDGQYNRIADNLTDEQYQEMWELLQVAFPKGYEGIGGYLIIKEGDE